MLALKSRPRCTFSSPRAGQPSVLSDRYRVRPVRVDFLIIMNQIAHVHVLSLGFMHRAGWYWEMADFLDAPVPQGRDVIEQRQGKELYVFVNMTYKDCLSAILEAKVSVRAIDPVNKLGYNVWVDLNASSLVVVEGYSTDVTIGKGFVLVKLQKLGIGVNVFIELF